MPNPTRPFSTIASAPIFVVSATIGSPEVPPLHDIAFQELGGISSEVKIEQYISSDIIGYANLTKQFGLVQPPTVTLKRGLDNSLTLWAWHQLAVRGDPLARAQEMSLQIFGGGLNGVRDAKPLMSYTLSNAWCAKINISSAKAGEGFLTEEVVIACDEIFLDQPGDF